MVMKSFRDDCWEVYVISNNYGMGDPLASRFREAGRTADEKGEAKNSPMSFGKGR
jgi:hypothetical protein